MSDRKPLVIPPLDALREQIAAVQSELRRLRKLYVLAKAASEETAVPACSARRRSAQRTGNTP